MVEARRVDPGTSSGSIPRTDDPDITMRLSYLTIAMAALAPITSLAVAAEGSSPPRAVSQGTTPTTADETIVVTAERRETSLERSTADVSVIDAADDRRLGHPLNPADLLDGLPGVDVLPTGGGLDGGSTSVRLRGGRAQDTQYLVDGIPCNDPASIDGAPNAAFLSTAGLDRIEVVRGAQSGLYGARAVGGVVNLITLRPTPTLQASGRAEAGSWDTYRLDAEASGPVDEQLGYALGFSGLSSRGFSSLTTPGADGDPGQHEADGLRRGSATGRLEFRPDPLTMVYLGGNYSAFNQDWDSYDAFTFVPLPDDAASNTRVRSWRGSAGGEIKPGETLTLSADTALSVTHRVLDDSQFGLSAFDTRERYAALRGLWRPLRELTFSLGSDGKWDQAETGAMDAADRMVGIWGQAATSLPYGEASATLRQDRHSRDGGATTWRLGGAGFIPDERVKVHASLATGFTPPSLDQLYGTYPGFFATVGNPDLTAETSLSRDLGLTLRPERGIVADVTAFRTDYHDKIEYYDPDGIGGLPATYRNRPDARVEGVEGSLAFDESRYPVVVRASCTWQHFDDDSNAMQRLLPNRKARLEAGYRWRQPKVWLGANLDAVGRRPDLFGTGTLHGYALLGATLRWTIDKTWEIYLRGENLGDVRYEVNPGYSTPGRSGAVGLTATF
jgi:vitamin B12 transporter